MRRFLLAWLLLLAGILCLSHADAFWQSRDSNYNVATSGAPPSCTPTTIFTATGATSSDDMGWGGYTVRDQIGATLLSSPNTCTTTAITLKSASTATGISVSAAYICNSTTATVYACTSTPVQLTVSGSGSWSVAGSGATVTTDYVNFVWDGSSWLVIAIYTASATDYNLSDFAGGPANTQIYYKSGSDASNQSPSAYTTYTQYSVDGVTAILVK